MACETPSALIQAGIGSVILCERPPPCVIAQRLTQGLEGLNGVEVLGATEANIVFCRLPSAIIESLLQAGFEFYHDRWGPNVVRFVTSFSTTVEDVDNLLAHVTRAAVAR